MHTLANAPLPSTLMQEQGLSMIQAGNLQGLSDLLSPLELSPLKPLLLLLGWDRYPDHTTRRELLELLWPPVSGNTVIARF